MTKQEKLNKLDAVRSVVASSPAGVEFAPDEIEEDPCRGLLSVRLVSGIEAFKEPVGLLISTENFNWFGFLSGDVLVYQGFPREATITTHNAGYDTSRRGYANAALAVAELQEEMT